MTSYQPTCSARRYRKRSTTFMIQNVEECAESLKNAAKCEHGERPVGHVDEPLLPAAEPV